MNTIKISLTSNVLEITINDEPLNFLANQTQSLVAESSVISFVDLTDNSGVSFFLDKCDGSIMPQVDVRYIRGITDNLPDWNISVTPQEYVREETVRCANPKCQYQIEIPNGIQLYYETQNEFITRMDSVGSSVETNDVSEQEMLQANIIMQRILASIADHNRAVLEKQQSECINASCTASVFEGSSTPDVAACCSTFDTSTFDTSTVEQSS